MKKVLTIGSATQDIFIKYENPQAAMLEDSSDKRSYLLVEEGSKIEVDEIHYATGGGSTNSAVSFKQLGFDVASFFQTGNDPEAQKIRARLLQKGINIDYAITDNKYKTGRSFILPSPTGNQPILAYRGSNAFVKAENLPLDHLTNFDFLYITSLSGQSSKCLLPLAKTAHDNGIMVATNPGTSQLAAGAEKLREALPYISILLLNATEASQLMYSFVKENKFVKSSSKIVSIDGPILLQKPITYKEIAFDLFDFFKTVHEQGPQKIVVTNGAEGVYMSDQKALYFHASQPVDVISTVGAGDAFGSCFVASLMNNKLIEEALKNGICNAASVITHLGPKEGLLNFQGLEMHTKLISLAKVKIFEL